ncbi:chaperonin 10-like protein [Mycena olivaceomarginata]|nr:chaperonin 10-like protein [Mycena olivaceomarginata]
MPEGTMKALWYNGVPIPTIGDDDVLLKVSCCGVCGTDGHIHDGEFISKFPLIPGHEAIGSIVEMGKNVKGFSIGDRCVADVGITVRRARMHASASMLTLIFSAMTASTAAAVNHSSAKTSTRAALLRTAVFAEYIAYQQKKLYKIQNLTDEESTLLEPASCAIHGLDKVPNSPRDFGRNGGPAPRRGPPPVSSSRNYSKLNGASRVVIAANKGIKMDIAKDLDAADEYIELDRQDPEAQWKKLKEDNPYGFDIIGSFSQTYCFPRAVAYLDSGKVRVKGMVTDVFKLDDYQAALDKMNSRGALKIAISRDEGIKWTLSHCYFFLLESPAEKSSKTKVRLSFVSTSFLADRR